MPGQADGIHPCPVCGKTNWAHLDLPRTGLCMTTTQEILEGNLDKRICAGCGVGRGIFSGVQNEGVDHYYRTHYDLAGAGVESHAVFDQGAVMKRHAAVAEWLGHFIDPTATGELVEVGCGDGSLLEQLAVSQPLLHLHGIEPAEGPAARAVGKGLDVRSGPLEIFDSGAVFDFVVAWGVLEHIERPDEFARSLDRLLAPKGLALVGLPSLDEITHDPFMADHLWHFSSGHVIRLMQHHGLAAAAVASHPLHAGFNLFLVSRQAARFIGPEFKSPESKGRIVESIDYWTSRIERINEWLVGEPSVPIAVFGTSEICTLLACHTELRRMKIECYLDENRERVGTQLRGIPIRHPEHLTGIENLRILLAVRPALQQEIRSRLIARHPFLDERILDWR